MHNASNGIQPGPVPRSAPGLLSVVVPVYNEQDVIPLLLDRMKALEKGIPVPLEIVFVDDGSTDASLSLLRDASRHNTNLHVLSLSRNFGHQIAATAGLDYARGDAVVLMDGDLQDPPELIHEMLREYLRGFDVVYAKRTGRLNESAIKRAPAWLFYRFIRAFIHRDLPSDTGEFRLLSRQCLDAFKKMRERHRFIRGMIVWVGFHQTAVSFERPSRARGKTKYSFPKMLRLAWDATVSFSMLPLRLSLILGLLLVLSAILYGCSQMLGFGGGSSAIRGWGGLMAFHILIGGIILTAVGILGEYIGRMFEEIQGRPLYIVNREVTGTALCDNRASDSGNDARILPPGNGARSRSNSAEP
ncbi:MAG: glycosyltransferase family 2 protein [Acidobacteria bacterium]|nr:glycosyltransferase family 2 protein [Acidobacteriota bacterium]